MRGRDRVEAGGSPSTLKVGTRVRIVGGPYDGEEAWYLGLIAGNLLKVDILRVGRLHRAVVKEAVPSLDSPPSSS